MEKTISSQRLDVDISDDEGFDLLQTFRTLRAGWQTIIAAVCACLIIAVLYLHIAQPTYTATIILSATQAQSQNISGNISELASMAGITIGKGQSASPFALFPYALISRPVADDLIKHSPDVMPMIFSNEWDAASGQWREPGGIHVIVRLVKGVLGFPENEWTAPGGGELQQYIKKHIDVDVSTQKPVVTLTFDYRKQAFAAHFLQAAYESTDRVLRKMILDRSSKYARYLQQQLPNAQLTELRQVMMQSLNEQETLVMMSSSDTPFAAQPMGAAVSSTQPTFPNAPIILLLAAVSGLILGSAAVLSDIRSLRFPFRYQRDRSPTREVYPATGNKHA